MPTLNNQTLMNLLERTTGLTIGHANIWSIQQVGTKHKDKLYINDEDGKLYRCTATNTTTDVVVLPNFIEHGLSDVYEWLDGRMGFTQDSLKYIQTPGTKYPNRLYIDKNNGKVYLCHTETAAVTNSANDFVEYTDRLHFRNDVENLYSGPMRSIPALIKVSKFRFLKINVHHGGPSTDVKYWDSNTYDIVLTRVPFTHYLGGTPPTSPTQPETGAYVTVRTHSNGELTFVVSNPTLQGNNTIDIFGVY